MTDRFDEMARNVSASYEIRLEKSGEGSDAIAAALRRTHNEAIELCANKAANDPTLCGEALARKFDEMKEKP